MRSIRVGLAARTATALALMLALGLLLVPAPTTASARQAVSDALMPATAGWHGRAVQQPHAHDAVRASTSPAPSGWSAGAASLGTGTRSATGSRRVREVQRRLRRLGYHAGPVDGRFGPRTRAAVAWFQRKHGLPLDGRATLATVRHLRTRAGAEDTGRPADAPAGGSAESAAPPALAEPSVVPAPGAPDAAASRGWTAAAIGLLAAGLVLLGLALLLQRRRTGTPAPRVIPIARASAPTQAQRPRALGYVRLARGAPSASFHAQAAAIETGCLARGMTLVGLLSDLEPDAREQPRPPALAYALERLEARDVDRLVISRLDHLARTREEAQDLLGSIAEREAGLVVLDRDLDTAALPGSQALDALLLAEPAAPARLRAPGQIRPVDDHIASMLEEGLDPGAIAAALNDEPVPPPQGSRWGSAGVEAALRRRRDTARMERTDA